MNIDLTTPALLFSTISLLLLAYTNRFLALASVIRKLHADHMTDPKQVYVAQIVNLRRRVRIIRDMQTLGVSSLLACTICMGAIFWEQQALGKAIFVASLLLMCGSLALSIVEIRMSVGALDLHLKDMEN
jgi:hypothetical protein